MWMFISNAVTHSKVTRIQSNISKYSTNQCILPVNHLEIGMGHFRFQLSSFLFLSRLLSLDLSLYFSLSSHSIWNNAVPFQFFFQSLLVWYKQNGAEKCESNFHQLFCISVDSVIDTVGERLLLLLMKQISTGFSAQSISIRMDHIVTAKIWLLLCYRISVAVLSLNRLSSFCVKIETNTNKKKTSYQVSCITTTRISSTLASLCRIYSFWYWPPACMSWVDFWCVETWIK